MSSARHAAAGALGWPRPRRRRAVYRVLRMGNAATPDRSSPPAAKLTSLLPAAGALSAQEVADRLGLPASLPDRQARPYVMLNMVSSADGRATIGGRSGPPGRAGGRP